MKVTKKRQKEFVRERLSSSKTWALKALVTIYNYQTNEEQRIGYTKMNNGVGFSGVDSDIMTSFAQFYLSNGFLTPKQMNILYKKIPKYWKQIIKVSDKEKLNKIILDID